MSGRNTLYRPTPTSWQPPKRCECNQLRCRLARVEAERDALADTAAALAEFAAGLLTDARRELAVMSA